MKMVLITIAFYTLRVTNAFITPTGLGGVGHSRDNGSIEYASYNKASSILKMSNPSRSNFRMGLVNNNRKSPMKYLRILPKSTRRNRKKHRVFELQTAVTTLGKRLDDGTEVTIDLHAQLHFGEQRYFQYYNEDDFCDKYDNVFYELIVSDDMLHKEEDGTRRLLPLKNNDSNLLSSNPNPVAPTPSDESTASSYGLSCQLNVIDYTKPNFIHCDVTRDEYLSFFTSSDSAPNGNALQPVWAMTSTAMAPIQEYTSALLRPSTPSSTRNSVSQFSSTRLFSNLFLPGANLASIFRVLLWVLSPSPEVSILLLDWSSIVNPKPNGLISPIFIPSVESVLSGNLLDARKLIFAQLLVSGQTAGGQDMNLVRKRNSFALNTIIDKVINSSDRTQKLNSNTSNAVLYGAMHCQDLQSRLERSGFSLRKVEWRKAWSVNVPIFGLGESPKKGTKPSSTNNPLLVSDFVSANNPNDIGVGLIIVPLYLAIGGLDWISTIKDVSQALDKSLWTEGVLIATFYVLRHLVLYCGLAKFVIEWDGDSNLFSGDTN